MTDPRTLPIVGSEWVDAAGRRFTVDAVHVGDRLGREVVGTLLHPGDPIDYPYSCPLLTWAAVWRDRAPRLAPEKQRIG
jgi:hypothetical protein